MANKKTNEEDGVWRTIGGRRVFIRNGQSLADAMKESGKFSNLNKNVTTHKHSSEVKKEEKKKDDYTKETDPEKRLKNVYMMDRVLRSMNNEEALDDGWLMNGVADGDSDYGYEKFKENSEMYDGKGYYYTSDEDYKNLVDMYKRRVKYAKDGLITDDKELVDFVKNDVESFPVYNDIHDDEVYDAKDGKVYTGMKSYKEEEARRIASNVKVDDTGKETIISGNGDELLAWTNSEEEATGVEIPRATKQMLEDNPDKQFQFRNEEYSFEDIKNDLTNAETYEDIQGAINKIGDETMREEATKLLKECDNNGSSAEEASNRVASKYIDKYIDPNKDYENAIVERDYVHKYEKENNKEENLDDGGVLKDTAIKAYDNGDISYEELRDNYFDGDGQDVGEALSKANSERAKKELSMPDDDYEYNLYKQSRENPDDINPMTEWSTDWEELDKKYKDRYDKEYKGLTEEGKRIAKGQFKNQEEKEAWEKAGKETQELLKHDDLRQAKEKALQTKKDAENKWIEHYNNSNWNDENWRKEDDRLSQERDKSREEYDKAMKEYLAVADDSELSWEDKVARNDIRQEEELKKYSGFRNDEERDKYYEVFRKYERENAKLKAEGAKPEDEYVPLNSWGSFHNKMEELTKDNANAKWTGKEYTNDEFMEHLEDANWHTERRMLETAGLTNQEMEYIKDHTTLAAWSADLDRDKTQKLIDEAKDKFRNNNVPKNYEKGNAPFESKRVAENEIREKGYQYFSTHGVGPGTHPNDVKSRELDVELPGGWTTFKTDRPLTQQELDYYDIQPETRNSEFRKRFGLNEDNTKKTTNQTMNDAIRQSASKKSKKTYSDWTRVNKENNNRSQRYSGTLAYLKEMGLTQHTIDEIIKRMEEDNKK